MKKKFSIRTCILLPDLSILNPTPLIENTLQVADLILETETGVTAEVAVATGVAAEVAVATGVVAEVAVATGVAAEVTVATGVEAMTDEIVEVPVPVDNPNKFLAVINITFLSPLLVVSLIKMAPVICPSMRYVIKQN